MNLVIEGPDGTGKSTLARVISELWGWPIISSKGPEKRPGEILERIRLYTEMNHTIFDRHPAVSQSIYNKFREGGTPVPEFMWDRVRSKSVLILCYSITQLGHVVKPHDTVSHLEMVDKNRFAILQAYFDWAHRVGALFYQTGHPHNLLINRAAREIQKCEPSIQLPMLRSSTGTSE